MAGDWIKVEHATPDKPEVVQLAEILGIDQDLAFAKLVRFWIWSDQQSVDGNDLGVTPAFFDRLTNCPGFYAAAIKVGWLIDRNGRLSVPNFARHNGQTAKNRALAKDRQSRSRNAKTVTKPSPEKRREEKNIDHLPPSARARDGPSEIEQRLETFLADWNRTPGVVPCASKYVINRPDLAVARFGDPAWMANYREALAKFPLPFFETDMTVVQFLKPDTVANILAGQYATKRQNGNGNGHVRHGLDPSLFEPRGTA